MILLEGIYEDGKFILRYVEGDHEGEVYRVFEYGKVVELPCKRKYFVRRINFYDGSGQALFITRIKRQEEELSSEELFKVTDDRGGTPLMERTLFWPTTRREVHKFSLGRRP